MAQNKKGRRTRTTAKKNQAGNTRGTQEMGFRYEILLIVALAVAIFLEISNFGACGSIGNAISGFLFGVFGWIEYGLPILIFVGMAFLFANGFSSVAIRKTVYAAVLCLDISMIAQLIVRLPERVTLGELYMTALKEKSGGGFIGGGLTFLLQSGIGVAGTWLVVIVLAVVMVILLTEKSVIKLLQKSGVRLMDGFEEAKQQGQEYQERRKEERNTLEEIRAAKRAERESARQEQREKAKNELELKREAARQEQERRKEAAEKEKAKEELEKEAAGSNQEPEYNRFQHKVKKGLFRNLTVLPEQGQEGTVKQDTFRKKGTANPEEIHEITMTIADVDMDIDMDADTTLNPDATVNANVTMQVDMTELSANEEKKPEQKRREKRTVQPESKTKTAVPEAVEKLQPVQQTEPAASAKPVVKEKTAARNQNGTERDYQFPPYDLLQKGKGGKKSNDGYIQETMQKLQSTLDSFGVRATITDYSCGPAVTRFELQPEQGVKVSKIVGLADDIKLNLAASDIRIEAPIPGKAAVGIEIPNKENVAVMFRDLIEDDSFVKFPSDIAFAVGKDIGGQVMVADIAKMPHLLIAGATGSGKSVCINTIIMSILYKAHPEDVKLIMIDPKVVELTAYNGIPHLLIPVVTDPKKAAGALNWAVVEMTKRYQLFAEYNVRNLKGYNKKVEEVQAQVGAEESELKKLPQIVVIVDELADLMMVAHGEVEDAIVRLSQLARAAGIHLVIATQRPSVDVITGLIKANVPSRIAFAVSSLVDSRTILDMAGAEKLLGKGDMLFYPTGFPKPVRVQGAFVSDEEVGAVVEFLKNQAKETAYDAEITTQLEQASAGSDTVTGSGSTGPERDEYFMEAAKVIIESDKASIGMLQRRFKIGFNRAARIMDQLAEAGVVGPDEGTKPRTILMSPEQLEEFMET